MYPTLPTMCSISARPPPLTAPVLQPPRGVDPALMYYTDWLVASRIFRCLGARAQWQVFRQRVFLKASRWPLGVSQILRNPSNEFQVLPVLSVVRHYRPKARSLSLTEVSTTLMNVVSPGIPVAAVGQLFVHTPLENPPSTPHPYRECSSVSRRRLIPEPQPYLPSNTSSCTPNRSKRCQQPHKS